jgi:hypothetical protein
MKKSLFSLFVFAVMMVIGCSENQINDPVSNDEQYSLYKEGLGPLKRFEVPAEINAPPVVAVIFDDGESDWVPIVFPRDPLQIPLLMNLYTPHHEVQPGFMNVPLLLEGFVLLPRDWAPPVPPIAVFAHFRNPTGQTVPIWFMSRADFETAAVDDIVTIEEINNMPSLLKGEAGAFNLFASPLANIFRIQVQSAGALEDNTLFTFSVQFIVETESYTHFNLHFGN